LGIAFLPEEEFAQYIEEGRLVRVLQDWCAPFEGYYLYYLSRRQPFTGVLAGARCAAFYWT